MYLGVVNVDARIIKKFILEN